ncbi:endonuclease MutS2 [Chloropicon primus]|uniref:Endonuclease MutS2 n=3 Tax=Chloropicon primus TaxID=1764295 RepID=A0A5B8MEH2_9CHLO|nr:endonuclease MutS2 [Chloropicon primus]UPQ98227.1 endonuclease MutS2 [Chloropicon primus]|eukprot:QDZ19018.1 endonuclease MutS2 [Chloropicon primus]
MAPARCARPQGLRSTSTCRPPRRRVDLNHLLTGGGGAGTRRRESWKAPSGERSPPAATRSGSGERATGQHVSAKTRKPDEVDAYTLKILDWESVCSHVSIFTSTKLGRLECYGMELGSDVERSERLQGETRAVHCLEAELGKRVEFRGVDSSLVQSAIRRAENGGRLSPELFRSVLTLMTCMDQIKSLVKSSFQSQKGPTKQRLSPLMGFVEDLSSCKQLQKEIGERIDEDNNVRDNASKTLSKLRGQIGVLERKVLAQVRGKGESPTTHKGRVCLEIFPTELPKYEKTCLLIGNAETGGMLYVEPTSVIAMNNNLMELRTQEAAEIETICWQLTSMVTEELPELQRLFEVLVRLDTIVARARYTISVNGNWPQLVEAGGKAGNEKFAVRLKQLRNPLLLWEQRKAQMASSSSKKEVEAKKPVPVDIFVEKGVSAIVITGPNTGGKTACMKALGIVSLMSRAGLGVPASGSVILPAFDNVYADIGDEQSLSNNLSTFSSHVKHIQSISEHCTGRSLVLLDELGTGTDPMEGSALGAAIMKSFLGRAQLTIATTHFGHISGLKYVDSRVENAAVDFDPDTLSPTYQIIWGASGKSNAFHIATSLGLQEEILSEAMEIAGSASADSGSELADALEALKVSMEESSYKVRRSIMRTRTMYESANKALHSLKVDQLKLNQKKSSSLVRILEESREKVKEIMKAQMREEAESRRRRSESKATSKVGKLVTKVQKKRDKRLKRSKMTKLKLNEAWVHPGQTGGAAPGVGSTVFIPQFKAKAKVLSVEGSDLVVQMGAVKMKVKRNSVQNSS